MSCWWTVLFYSWENSTLEALKSFCQLLSVFHPKSQVLRHCWNKRAMVWSEMREGNRPSDASGPTWLHVWCVWSSRGRGGWKQVLALPPHAQILPATILQPWANQQREKGAALVPPENVTSDVWPTMVSSEESACFGKCCQLCKRCSHHGKGLLTSQSPARRVVPEDVFQYFCRIKSPSKSNLFSMQIVFAQLGKYWTSKFFLGNKFPSKSMRQASHLFLWCFVIY